MTRWRRAHARTHTYTHTNTDTHDHTLNTTTTTTTTIAWTRAHAHAHARNGRGNLFYFFSLSHTRSLAPSISLSLPFRFFFFGRLLTGARDLRRRRRVRGPRSAGRRRLVSPRARRAVTQNRVRTATEKWVSGRETHGLGTKTSDERSDGLDDG